MKCAINMPYQYAAGIGRLWLCRPLPSRARQPSPASRWVGRGRLRRAAARDSLGVFAHGFEHRVDERGVILDP